MTHPRPSLLHPRPSFLRREESRIAQRPEMVWPPSFTFGTYEDGF